MSSPDDKDFSILEALERDARQSTADIARSTHLPRVTVHERIRKMKERGLIRKFAALPDYERLGFPVTSFVLVSYAHSPQVSQRKLAHQIAALPSVHEVFLISGEWDLLLKVRGRTVKEIGEIVIDKLRAMPGVARTLTLSCFETVKEEP